MTTPAECVCYDGGSSWHEGAMITEYHLDPNPDCKVHFPDCPAAAGRDCDNEKRHPAHDDCPGILVPGGPLWTPDMPREVTEANHFPEDYREGSTG